MADLPPILIIRAEPGARESAQRVEALGLRAVVSPVLSMKTLAAPEQPTPQSLAGLVFTSANGVRAYAARAVDVSLPAWCVGPATAAAARSAGFTHIHESAGNAVDLAHFIAQRSVPSGKPLLHIANAAAKGDLKRQLETHGFSVAFAPLYEMQGAETLSEEAVHVLREGGPACVLIHSAKGATRFAELVADLPTDHLTAVAISEPAIAPLQTMTLAARYVASTPNEDGVIAALQSAIATLSA
nr:uroporphyrinogen-III synthase [Hyphomonas sp. Mor2]